MDEGHTIQHQFDQTPEKNSPANTSNICQAHDGRKQQFDQTPYNQRRTAQLIPQIFAGHMMEGRVKAALQLISEDNSNSLLHLDNHVNSDSFETVWDILYMNTHRDNH